MTKEKITSQICHSCLKDLAVRNYYKVDSPLFTSGYAPVCKKCMADVVDEYSENLEGMRAVLKVLDKPLLEEMYEEGETGKYMRLVQSLRQYRDLTYDDSNVFKIKRRNQSKSEEMELEELTYEEAQALEEFWGKGYTEEEYLYLTKEWLEYKASYPIETKPMEEYIKKICETQLDLHRLRASTHKVNSKEIDVLIKRLDTLYSSANIKPTQETSAHGHQKETFGTLIKRFETENPIPEPLKEWEDVDNISKQIRVWFTGMMHDSLNLPYKFEDEYKEEKAKYTVDPDSVRGEQDE